MKRQTLDEMGPEAGARVRIFFPHGGGPRVMLAGGEVRASSSSRAEHDHLMRDENVPRGLAKDEWVPGWYVASLAGSRRS